MTIGDKYKPAMGILDQAEADAWLEKLVKDNMANSEHTRKEALEIERQNLGYFAGYYSHEVRERVERLFRCAHPIFGKIAENGPPSTLEAFEAGLRAGRRARKRG